MMQRWSSLVDLVLFRSSADLLAERERTYLGFAWWLIAPACFLGTFVLVFGGIFSQRGAEFVVYLLVGLTWWQWFTSCVTHGASAILDNLTVVRQVPIPPIVFPLVSVLTDTYKFLIVLALLLAILWVSGHPPQVSWLTIPVLLLQSLLAIVALTTLVAAFVPLVPDMRFAVDTMLHMLMFLSGLFYYRDQLPENLRWVLDLNPIYQMIAAWRRALIDGVMVDPLNAVIALSVSIGLAWFGAQVVSHFSDQYAKAPQ